MTMIERHIFTALSDGVAEMTANPKRLSQIFEFYLGVDAAEVEKIRTYYATNPPAVIHNYPREDSAFPLYAITLAEESEPIKFLGDSGGFVTAAEVADYAGFEADGVRGADLNASIYQHQYQIYVYATHPDVCVWYYHLAKYFMTRARDFFVTCGLFEMSLGGADLIPDPRYAPAFLFRRVLRFGCQSVLEVVGAVPPRAPQVGGIHVEGGRNLPVTGVRTLVKTFISE